MISSFCATLRHPASARAKLERFSILMNFFLLFLSFVFVLRFFLFAFKRRRRGIHVQAAEAQKSYMPKATKKNDSSRLRCLAFVTRATHSRHRSKKDANEGNFFFVICLLAKHRDRRFWTSPFWFSASLLTVSSQINARESLLVVERANIRDRTVTWRTSLPSLCRWHTRVSLDPKDSTHSRLNYGVRAARCLAP